ncbi:MAG: hypothetical protein V1889_00350 [archaeon]
MVLKNHPLSGEERKIVSTRLYRSEFLYLKKLCEQESKSVNAKLREIIRKEFNLGAEDGE